MRFLALGSNIQAFLQEVSVEAFLSAYQSGLGLCLWNVHRFYPKLLKCLPMVLNALGLATTHYCGQLCGPSLDNKYVACVKQRRRSSPAQDQLEDVQDHPKRAYSACPSRGCLLSTQWPNHTIRIIENNHM